MKPVEASHLRIELRVRLPGGPHEHRDRVPHVPAAMDEQLDRVVEHRRVGARRVQDGLENPAVGGSEPTFAGAHPVRVALDRVDLAVVTEVAEGLRPLPRRLGVRREPLMKDPERNREGRVTKVVVELVELVGGAEGLVSHGPKRERSDVGAPGPLCPAASSVRAALGLLRVGACRTDEHRLLDRRRGGARRGSEGVGADRDGTPARDPDSLEPAGLFDCLSRSLVAQKDHCQAGFELR